MARGYPASVRSITIKRQMNSDDIAEVSELLADAERADGVRPLSDHLWLDLRQGGRQGFAGLVSSEVGHEHPVAYCQLSRGNESWALDLVVHPHHRYDTDTIGPELISAALSIVADEGGGHVHWWVFEPAQLHRDLANQFGLREGRRLLQLRRPLPLEPAIAARGHDIDTKPFRPDTDVDEWLRVNNAAFAEHPEQGAWDRSTFAARMSEPWFDPLGLRMLSVDGRLTGFCWTKVHRDTHPLIGEIYVIAVDPTTTGRGLGGSLTAAGLNYLSSVGAQTAMLFVDADNERAKKMYAALGFVAHHVERAFVGDVAPRN